MSITAEERRTIVEFRIENALLALEQFQGVIVLKDWETIAILLYYAAYNAISALLIAKGNTVQTHSGVIYLFIQQFIKTGVFPAEMGRLYFNLFAMCPTGDHDDTCGITEEDVLPLVEPTKKLIEQIIELAKKLLKE